MAYLIPSDLSQLFLSDPHNPEIPVLKMLGDELPDDYTVFHGVHWSLEYQKWTHFGEIDFVILNQSGKVLVIEQKNGPLEETKDGLVKRYTTQEKNPVQQLNRSINKVQDKFKKANPQHSRIEIDYLVYCPDYKVKDANAAGVGKNRIVDANSKNILAKKIEKILGKGEKSTDGQYERVRKFFSQTFHLVPDIHSHITSQEIAFKRHIGEHARILMDLEMQPFRLKINGNAGSGKSQFAREYFDRELRQNHKILMLCFNRPLSDQLRQSIGTAGTVNTFLEFCGEFLHSVGGKFNYEKMQSNQNFWKDVMDEIMNFEITDDWKYDSLIVDEGQDFEQDWFEIIQLFLHDNANILWLEDIDQNLYGKPPVKLNNLVDRQFVGYQYQVNYRSPESIARFILQTLPFEFELGNKLLGLGVKIHAYNETSEQPSLVSNIVKKLMKDGFAYHQIIVLACCGLKRSVFYSLDRVGNVSLRKFTGYNNTGQQLYSTGDLKFDSVYRYKGLEMPAVILVDVDPVGNRIDNFNSLLYCGMTRATVRLEMVVKKQNPFNKRFLNWKP
ncbi:MAG: NERD domain-containing protein [Gammaproteobacteria bacterium]|nr:NERD domain-containing protein [Gammaproteobacteria bacterium]MCY4275648.1 NERD domain-containing protein [Gammaproteobacteria bacterium]